MSLTQRIYCFSRTAYREEFRDLAVWCQDNNLFLNVSKTKELIVDYRKRRVVRTVHHWGQASYHPGPIY
jgi:hypothetical protein